VGLSLVVGVLLHGYVARASAAARGFGPQTSVVVAARFVPRGTLLSPADVQTLRMPQAFVGPGALTSVGQATGRAALTDLATGEVVTRTRLARVRAGPVASLVPQGLRAFAVPSTLPVGAVRSGDHVDVLGTFGAGGAGQPHTETVAEGLEVLFVLGPGQPGDQSGGGGLNLDVSGAGAGSAVTLIVLVAPYQEEKLAFARAFANLEVAIAPPGGTSLLGSTGPG
jgi:Flp pilus assembly protein CpaB